MSPNASRIGRRVVDWLDERSGIRALIRGALDEPVPGGARWSYVFGSCLVFLLIEQAVTGVLMAAFYSPSVTDAWASVAYLQDQLTLGWFIRGLHSAGASAMIAVILLHLLQVTVFGAYKRPREINWLVGVLLFVFTLAFALTGYLLPWDQKGYWATQVATGLLGATPVAGRFLQRLVQGGDNYGNLTLTHFYALHVFVFPSLVLLFTAAHVALFRRHGVTPSWRDSDEEVARKTVPFYPDQLALDLAAIVLLLGVLVVWVVGTHGQSLDAPADPASAYDARPEWYNMPLFEVLKLFPGRWEVPAALGAPALFMGLLLLIPFLDRRPGRDPRRRKPWIGLVATAVLAAVALGFTARQEDRRSESYQRQRARDEREAVRARTLALQGVPAAGGTAVFENDAEAQARRLFAVRCAGCHLFDGAGDNFAPTLDGWGSRAWLAGLLRDPDNVHYFGKTKIRGMKPVAAPDDEIRALVEYVAALGGAAGVDEALRARGQALFKERDCDECHEVDGTSSGQGPNLGGRGSLAWLEAMIRDASAPHLFGKKNEMAKFAEKLSAAEIESLAGLLLSQRGR